MTNIKTAIYQVAIDLIDAKYLMCFVLNVELNQLPLLFDSNLTTAQYNQFKQLVDLRKIGKPVDIIIGKKHFWDGEFIVDKNVLSPRPDSEVIIENVLNRFGDTNKPYRILDLGTGSGCLLISLLRQYHNATGVGVDISTQALKIAKQNAMHNQVIERIEFVTSNWLENLAVQQFDIIVSNPPYIASADIATLSNEVRVYDPQLALDGGADGLNSYRIISKQIGQYMTGQSLLFVEFGINQSWGVEKIFNSHNFATIHRAKDLANIPRCHTYKYIFKKST